MAEERGRAGDGASADSTPAETTLVMSRFENFWPLVICVMFSAAAVWLISEGRPVGWFSLALFGAGAGFLGWQSYSSDQWRLTLGARGFTVANPMNSFSVNWADVEEFGVWKHRGGLRVAWRLRAAAQDGSPSRRLGRMVGGGWDGALPSAYGRPAAALALQMEERRRAALEARAAPTPAR